MDRPGHRAQRHHRTAGSRHTETVGHGRVVLAATLRRVSYDLSFWPAGATDEPGLLADRLADDETRDLVADEQILAFRAELSRPVDVCGWPGR